MPYMMTGTVGAEMCNILELQAQGIGLKRYSISIQKVSSNMYCGILRWRDDHIMKEDNWVNVSINITYHNYRSNEDFTEWKYKTELELKDMVQEIIKTQNGIGLQS
jgi:hypothetical protein